MLIRKFATSVALSLGAISAWSCAPVDFAQNLSSSAANDGPADLGDPVHHAPPADTLVKFKPALAVRGASCTLCHGDINATLITDFGIGSSFAKHNDMNSVYGLRNDNWESAKFSTDIVVLADSVSNLTVASWVKSVVSRGNPNTAVTEAKSISISAPTVEKLRSFGVSAADRVRYRSAAGVTGSHPSVVYKTDHHSISGSIACDGDLILEGVAHLNNVTVTTTKGCRIHATESIFVTGPIQFTGNTDLANIQLISSRAVIFGMGRCSAKDHVQERFTRVPNAFPTRDESRSTAQKEQDIRDDSMKIDNLTDADCEPTSKVNFERVLVNSPQVHSRYNGTFKGTVIAETAGFRFGELKFVFDPIFEKVPVIPLIGAENSLKVVE